MRTFASLFSGVGGAEVAAAWLGFRPVFGVEYDPRIAAIHADNHHSTTLVSPVQEVNFADLSNRMPGLNWLHASPSCQSFSAMRRGWNNFPAETENEADRDASAATCQAIETFRPDIFTLENVKGYLKTFSLDRIRVTLEQQGYVTAETLRSPVEVGVPQVRNRFFLVAIRRDALRDESPVIGEFVRKEPVGWGEYLFEGELESWAEGKLYPSFVKDCPQIAAGEIEYPHLFFGTRVSSKRWTCTPSNKPSSTVTASQYKRRTVVIMPGGAVKAVPFDFLTRLQGFPGNFRWSGNKYVDYTGLGNAICPQVLISLVSPLIARVNWQ